uniref:Uncharacterized protein n=1 Tax=Oryza barthii TaxID=65489 RepID=A0A0D3GPY1_9ORYZ
MTDDTKICGAEVTAHATAKLGRRCDDRRCCSPQRRLADGRDREVATAQALETGKEGAARCGCEVHAGR